MICKTTSLSNFLEDKRNVKLYKKQTSHRACWNTFTENATEFIQKTSLEELSNAIQNLRKQYIWQDL